MRAVTYVTPDVHQEIFNRCNPEKGDILYIKDGATTGVATVNTLDEEFSMLSSVALMKCSGLVNNKYILEVLRSPYFLSSMRSDMTGVAITRVTLAKIGRALVPLPPFAEQQRIVIKIGELISLCSKLENYITSVQGTCEHFMKATFSNVE